MTAVAMYKDLELENESEYYDFRSGLSKEDYQKRLANSTTLYVGNLSFFTQESQLLEIFSFCGPVKNLHMGLNRQTYKPCGFCFVEFYNRDQASLAIQCLNLVLVDGKEIRIDWDYGFSHRRQYERDKEGGQVRTELNRINFRGTRPEDDGME